jgi:hypothetical protein
MKSLLAKAVRSAIVRDPFPYLVIEDAVDAALCARLVAEYPSLEILAQGQESGSNRRFSYPAHLALANARVSATWKAFVEAHLTPSFWKEIAACFGDEIRRLYPDFEREVGALDALSVGVKNRDQHRDILLDAQICANAPVDGPPSSCRPVHVDTPRKLFTGLFYLRREEDRSVGGDLELLRAKRPDFSATSYEVDAASCEVVRTIAYASNVLVIWINSPVSLHGTNLRCATPSTRLLFNVVGDVKKPLFEGAGPGALRRPPDAAV